MGSKADFLRKPKTARERREVERAEEQGVKIRRKRSKRGLPSDWDDIDRSGYGKHGWKQSKRKHQYRECAVTREDLIEAIVEGVEINLLKGEHNNLTRTLARRINNQNQPARPVHRYPTGLSNSIWDAISLARNAIDYGKERVKAKLKGKEWTGWPE